jgi:hypothetical protein
LTPEYLEFYARAKPGLDLLNIELPCRVWNLHAARPGDGSDIADAPSLANEEKVHEMSIYGSGAFEA